MKYKSNKEKSLADFITLKKKNQVLMKDKK